MKLQLAQVGLARRDKVAPAFEGCRPSDSPAYRRQPQCVTAWVGPPPGSADFFRRMAVASDALRADHVGAILLVHSLFPAVDMRHFLLALARRWPAGSFVIRQLAAQVLDDRSHDAGVYTRRFADLLERSLSRRPDTIAVRLVPWSGENHHLGRADAAVRLIDELAGLDLPPDQRIMLWGHGQAGNVLALVTGLLSADAASIDRFFAAAQIHYRLPAIGVIDVLVWHRVKELLLHRRALLAGLDVVTFGTPPRYAWNLRRTDRLLHFVNHRPTKGAAAYFASEPATLDDLVQSRSGDCVRQLAVTGTDTPPSRFAWRSWLANRGLSRLLDPDEVCSTVAERVTRGVSVSAQGTTLLVDYGPPTGAVAEHLAGHAVYTRLEWLLFHTEQIAQRLCGQVSSPALAA